MRHAPLALVPLLREQYIGTELDDEVRAAFGVLANPPIDKSLSHPSSRIYGLLPPPPRATPEVVHENAAKDTLTTFLSRR
jgi:hypothetical protein